MFRAHSKVRPTSSTLIDIAKYGKLGKRIPYYLSPSTYEALRKTMQNSFTDEII